MKSYKYIIVLLGYFLLFSLSVRVYANDPFKMVYPILSDTVINIQLNKSDTIDVSNISNSINGLSLDCKIIQLSKNSFVRVLLEDSLGKNYIVIENNRLRNSNDTVAFVEYCEETASLNNIKPKSLKFYIKDATFLLEKIRYTEVSSNPDIDYSGESFNTDSIKKRQTTKIVDNINKYNRENNKLWVAGVTPVSLMDYDAKKRVLGMGDDECDTQGIEYYVDGIFEFGEEDSIDNVVNDTIETANYQYINSFDWRNRHGKNWMTPCKDQGKSGYCTVFAVIGALEAVANLYYNKKIDMDLSEQDVVYSYARKYNIGSVSLYYKRGLFEENILDVIKSCGAIDEASVPFIDAGDVIVPFERSDSNECLFFKQYYYNRYNNIININKIKENLIKYGPLISGYNNIEGGRVLGGHAMALVGYNTIKEGDTINHRSSSYIGDDIIQKGDSRIGKTYWIFKNSYGENSQRNGYMYILFNDYKYMVNPYCIYTPLTSKLYSDEDIVCADNDGDGYYFWGIGERPANLPDWVPKEKDCDDSDAKYGPMNQYGAIKNLASEINDTIYITEPTDWDCDNFIWQHVVVKDGGILNVSSKIKFYKGVNILVQSSGELRVDGGKLENVDIKILSGGKLYVKNKGSIKKYKQIYIAPAATVRITNGVIN